MPRKSNTVCLICNKDIYRRLKRTPRAFCSQTCYGVSCRKPKYCVICNKEFLSSKNARTCSRTCANTNRIGIKYKNGRPLKDKVKRGSLVYFRLVERDGEKCILCGLGTLWEGRPLKLQVDHIDGNRLNDELTNKRLLCPNCHTQTDTFGGRNIKKKGIHD